MQALLDLFAQHALLALCLVVFLEQLGLPLPALPFLLLAGALSAASADGFALRAVAAASAAALVANALWFAAGRRLGRRVLNTLCRISISPDSCVRQNEASFARRGAATLVLAKFVPGLSVLAPPLAGALGMSIRAFAFFDLAGALLWTGTGIVLGRLFSAQINPVLQLLGELGHSAMAVAGGLLALYLLWRLWRRAQVKRELQRFERIAPDELARLLGQGQDLLAVDVRGLFPELPAQPRIPGARHLDLGRLDAAALAGWPLGAELVTYCACPNDASAVRAAQWLKAQGRRARVLTGGIEGWIEAGHATQLDQPPMLSREASSIT